MKRRKTVSVYVSPSTKQLDDPYGDAGAKVLVTVNRNEDAIEWLYSKRLLTQGRYATAIRFRRVYEAASIGSVPAIDYSKPFVTGGTPGDVFTDDLVEAGQQLAAITKAIGRDAISFLTQTVIAGCHFPALASRYAAILGLPAREARGYVRGRLAAILDDLAAYWGMGEARGRTRSTGIRASVEDLVAGQIDYDDEIVVYDPREQR